MFRNTERAALTNRLYLVPETGSNRRQFGAAPEADRAEVLRNAHGGPPARSGPPAKRPTMTHDATAARPQRLHPSMPWQRGAAYATRQVVALNGTSRDELPTITR